MQKSEKKTNEQPHKKFELNFVTFAVALIVPGGFIALGIYGIKKLLDKRKTEDVQTEGPKKRDVSDS